MSRLTNDPVALYAAMHEAIGDDDDTIGPASALLVALKAPHQRDERRSR